ncbi:hypothetical protein Poly21_41480 [Allorhodopirellula heiligendammensis]|uniref:Uncharacterized protein n=1 Tax=Allorhodopirellula heiligendammensis TaxID=2714739 RepID=A0A5C6C277_9BACT|nr:hypothetical protein Poly21_41480 [Allorhodopirellula heiligendammensis]
MQQNHKRDRSPLDCIPIADVVRRRLQSVLTEAKRLRLLLRIARELEDRSPRDETEVDRG